jgi:hypothetical protein
MWEIPKISEGSLEEGEKLSCGLQGCLEAERRHPAHVICGMCSRIE